jgi:hypothetical protein
MRAWGEEVALAARCNGDISKVRFGAERNAEAQFPCTFCGLQLRLPAFSGVAQFRTWFVSATNCPERLFLCESLPGMPD